ncbi:MAG: hypothetical protein DHS20C12_21080 [Pseudohongiella sp.]|nr:MAG: hypothetical protein DHS20C12_21080 [Pseudohongiella sp.]
MSRPSPKISLLLLLLIYTPQFSLAQPHLAESLRQDSALQDVAIIAIRSALGARPQTAVVRRSSFLMEISMYIDTYRATRNAGTLENIQNRYDAARAELLEPRLPSTIEELVSVLEML